ncbi:MAG: hypothetical protein ACOC0Q_06030 [Wenzhouxiangella sp.]
MPVFAVGADMLDNLGNKDEHGRQARIGHHGRNLRISRTGGFSLRQAVKAGRIGLAANTSHGLRLSSALGRGTQVATQNGRFVLRGRYGTGPVKVNLSKSGLSASLASDVGRLNLTHPARSSAKLFGVQVRGRKAASINAAALVVSALVALIQFLVIAVVVIVKVLAWLGIWLVEVTGTLLARWQAARSERTFKARFEQLKGFTQGLDPTLLPDKASRMRLLGHVLLQSGTLDAGALQARLEEIAATLRSKRKGADLLTLAEPIELGAETTANMDSDRTQAWCLLAAQLLFDGEEPDTILEQFLALDDLCLAIGEKTEAQEELLALIAEAGGIRLTVNDEPGGMEDKSTPPRDISASRLAAPFLTSLRA